MKVKIDTKEKLHVISIEEKEITANMTESLKKVILPFLEKPVKNLVINLQQVNEIDNNTAKTLLEIQQTFYAGNHSMIYCQLQSKVKKMLEENELLDLLNVTPTESEAWDMVQMEEIERELLE